MKTFKDLINTIDRPINADIVDAFDSLQEPNHLLEELDSTTEGFTHAFEILSGDGGITIFEFSSNLCAYDYSEKFVESCLNCDKTIIKARAIYLNSRASNSDLWVKLLKSYKIIEDLTKKIIIKIEYLETTKEYGYIDGFGIYAQKMFDRELDESKTKILEQINEMKKIIPILIDKQENPSGPLAVEE
jgi:hypothetical protein